MISKFFYIAWLLESPTKLFDDLYAFRPKPIITSNRFPEMFSKKTYSRLNRRLKR